MTWSLSYLFFLPHTDLFYSEENNDFNIYSNGPYMKVKLLPDFHFFFLSEIFLSIVSIAMVK